MNRDDKSFLTQLVQGVEKKIDNIDKHLEKTCDEVGELDKKMVRFDERLQNHLKDSEKKIRAKKDWILIIVALLATSTAVISLVHNWVAQ